MSSLEFLHGIEVVNFNNTGRPITTSKSAVIGILGTAGKGDVNKPVLILGSRKEAEENFGSLNPNDGFTIPRALDSIFAQGVGAVCVVVNVCNPEIHNSDITDEVLQIASNNQGYTVKKFINSVDVNKLGLVFKKAFDSNKQITLNSGVSAITFVKKLDGTVYVKDTDYTISGNIISIKDGGSISENEIVEITYNLSSITEGVDFTINKEKGLFQRLASGKIEKNSKLKLSYTYVDASKVQTQDLIGGVVDEINTGMKAFLDSQHVNKVKPNILIAPGFTHQVANQDSKNSIVAALEEIAEKVRGKIIADATNGTRIDAVSYRDTFGNKRVYCVYPFVKVDVNGSIQEMPSSQFVAGVFARVAEEEGFWMSPSNHEIYGIVGISKSIDFAIDDKSCTANYLNENEVATIIQEQGFRLWGNRTCASDPADAFVTRLNISDTLASSILANHLWAVDKAIGKNLLDTIVQGIKAYLRTLTARGAILGGTAYVNKELNPTTDIMNGIVTIDYEYTDAPPAEHIIFNARVVDNYVTEIF